MNKLFSNRQTLSILSIFIITSFVVSSLSLFVVYKHSLRNLEYNLTGIVERQKSLITELKEDGKTDEEIIDFIKKTREHYYRIGATGEIAIAHRENDSILFLLAFGKKSNFKIGVSKRGIPMVLALQGNSGFIKSEDYSGTKVYAAYGFLPELKWGVEAKLPTSEFHAAFYKALIISLLFSIVLISTGLYFLIKHLKFIFKAHYSEILESHIQLIEQKEEIETQNEEYRQINEELHKTRNEALENASFNEFLLQTIPFVMDIVDEEGAILYLSEKSKKIINGEAIGKKCWDVFRDTKTQCNDCPLKQKVDIGQTTVISTSNVLGNRNCDIYHTGILFKGQKAIMEILVDTTEQIRSKELNKVLKHSLDIYTDGIYWMDSDNRFVYVNEAGGRAFGCKPDELLGKSIYDVNPTANPESMAEMWQTLRTEGLYTTDTIHRRQDGSVFYVEVRTLYFKYNDKEYNCGFARDITERKKFELELIKAKELAEENEKKYSALFHETITGIALHKLIFDENQQPVDYITTDVNKAFEEILAVPKEQTIGKKASEILPHEELKKWLDIFAPVALNGGHYRYENFSPLNNKYFEGNVFSVEKNQFVVAFSDISDRKKAERELIAAKEKAEESDRLKTAFLQNISHEIRTPMNAIMGFSELLVMSFDDKPKLEYYTGIINQRCNDLLSIINDLLDISKIESGQLSVITENCDINNLFNELKMFFTEHKNRMKKQHLLFDMQARCEIQNFSITTDAVKLKQVFINLLNNAFKFTLKGKVEGGCFWDENRTLIFYVSDTGIGIPQDKHQYIFERFSQLTTAKSSLHGGNGLGLSIVKGLVKVLGGDIWLESEVGKGTTFYFTIRYENHSPLAELPAADHSAAKPYNFQNKSILIVEDDVYNSELIEEFLSGHGLVMLFAANGREAVDMALSKQPDLILMDIGLPDMSGYEAVHQIKRQKPSVKIIAQTAYAALEDRKKAIDSGCVDYLSKPLKAEELIETINKHL